MRCKNRQITGDQQQFYQYDFISNDLKNSQLAQSELYFARSARLTGNTITTPQTAKIA